jgi:hypothetical protein
MIPTLSFFFVRTDSLAVKGKKEKEKRNESYGTH